MTGGHLRGYRGVTEGPCDKRQVTGVTQGHPLTFWVLFVFKDLGPSQKAPFIGYKDPHKEPFRFTRISHKP